MDLIVTGKNHVHLNDKSFIRFHQNMRLDDN